MIVIVIALAFAALALVSLLGTAAIERGYPPTGQFVDVGGGRLHVVQLGRPDAPAVVLLHGASGNLGDMRLALGNKLAERYRVILVDRPGHGWSDRPDGRRDSSPKRQAELIHEALAKIGVSKATIVGHSWAGALATAYALEYPQETKGLVLLAPVTHPWPGGVGAINSLIATPYIGPVIAYIGVLPAGYFMIGPGVRGVFAPQSPPPDYAERTGVRMILRPSEFIANAQDLEDLKEFVRAQAPRYGEIKVPTAIISGDDNDKIVSTDIHSRAIAKQIPNAKLTVLPGIGHMVQFAATDLVVQAIDEVSR
ncbi:MAG: alpha/beta hydrolase [Pseudolabrys sp.]|nr:alpha/beta hydrolase [Pseudolabrys sp.]